MANSMVPPMPQNVGPLSRETTTDLTDLHAGKSIPRGTTKEKSKELDKYRAERKAKEERKKVYHLLNIIA
jgi:hypothetical protein